jgi:hypothetical protein
VKDLGVSAEPARFVGRGDPSIPAALGTALFQAPRPSGKPTLSFVTLDDGSVAVYLITQSRVADPSANPQLTMQRTNMLVSRASTGDLAAYVDEARRKAEVVKNPAAFE